MVDLINVYKYIYVSYSLYVFESLQKIETTNCAYVKTTTFWITYAVILNKFRSCVQASLKGLTIAMPLLKTSEKIEGPKTEIY